MPRVALAVDIGATKVALALVDPNFVVQQKEEILIGDSSSSVLWDRIEKSASAMVAGLNGNLIGVGIGSAGPIDLVQGSISPVNIAVWREFRVVEKFRELSGNQNVVLHGDAMALACAVAWAAAVMLVRRVARPVERVLAAARSIPRARISPVR